MAKNGGGEPSGNSGGALGFEASLWAAADKMRGHMDASECKHVCLGLVFPKCISDAFEEKREQLLLGFSDPNSEWFIKDEPQRAEAAEKRGEYLVCSMKIDENVRNYATKGDIAKNEVWQNGIEETPRDFVEHGTQIYAKT